MNKNLIIAGIIASIVVTIIVAMSMGGNKEFTAGGDINNTETTNIDIDADVTLGDEVNNDAKSEATNENVINIK